METLTLIGTVAGIVTTIITCLLIFVAPLRKWVVERFSKRKEMKLTLIEDKQLLRQINATLQKHIENDSLINNVFELQNEALMSLLRDNITEAYYKYLHSEGVPCFKRESIIRQYAIYHKMNGNTYVDQIYEEFLKFPVK